MERQGLRMGGAEWVMLGILSLFWGGSFFFIKVLVAALPPLTIVLGRVGIAATALHLYLAVRGDPMPRDLGSWRRFAVLGLLNNVVPFSLIVFGETRLSSGLAAILNASTPLFTALVGRYVARSETIGPGKAMGIAIGFVGVAVLTGPAVGDSGGDLAGIAACLGAALSYGFGSVYGRRLKDLPAIKVATGQVTASAAMLLPVAAIVDRPWTLPVPGIAPIAALLGLALVSTSLAYILFFRILGRAGATNVQLVTLLVPVSSLLLGALFLGEAVTASAVLGMALIAAGFACIDGRLIGARRPVSRVLSPPESGG